MTSGDCTCDEPVIGGSENWHPNDFRDPACPLHRSLDPALCADGCGRPADRERQMSDGHIELVCEPHATQEGE